MDEGHMRYFSVKKDSTVVQKEYAIDLWLEIWAAEI